MVTLCKGVKTLRNGPNVAEFPKSKPDLIMHRNHVTVRTPTLIKGFHLVSALHVCKREKKGRKVEDLEKSKDLFGLLKQNGLCPEFFPSLSCH